MMGRVSGRLADFTIITAEDPRTEELDAINQEIADGVLDVVGCVGGEAGKWSGEQVEEAKESRPSRFAIVPDRAEAIRFGVQMARAGDVVASFGKGHERSMCCGETEYPWNEQEAMLSALRARREERGAK